MCSTFCYSFSSDKEEVSYVFYTQKMMWLRAAIRSGDRTYTTFSDKTDTVTFRPTALNHQ
ncbi:hypothetical protein THZB04_150022 [Vibrio owensii]|nr:hypothetical protein THZB04_150022 [Vibrio owensii]